MSFKDLSKATAEKPSETRTATPEKTETVGPKKEAKPPKS
tara:strand:+ start:559 stop:678 length:120 start_codon:yes stop_codon:yes gene_type:complete